MLVAVGADFAAPNRPSLSVRSRGEGAPTNEPHRRGASIKSTSPSEIGGCAQRVGQPVDSAACCLSPALPAACRL